MHTVAFACKRVEGMSREEYARHYREIHAPLARRLPGLVEYRQMLLRDEADGPVVSAGYDSLSVYVFADDAAAAAAWASPEGIELNEDTPTFMDWDSVLTFPVASELSMAPIS
ncbi:MAG TPA: EthD family reductase [Baekduia sp.]|nr:EthD family reductase [Baekduia sp.]